MSPSEEKRQSLRSKFLRVTIPLIFLSVIGVFAVIELLAHRTAVAQLEQTLKAMIGQKQRSTILSAMTKTNGKPAFPHTTA